MQRPTSILVPAALALMLHACGGGDPAGPPGDGGQAPRQVDVRMEAATFDPARVSVRVGGTVRWVNATANPHTITPTNASQPGAWPEQNITGNGTAFSHTFTTAGTYDYHCRLHAGMTGTVRVE